MIVSQYEKDLESANLGIQAKAFMKSNIGKYLESKINDQVFSGLNNLKLADPFDSKEIQKIQNDIKVAEMIKFFLLQAIQEGYNAQQRLDEGNESVENEDRLVGYNNDNNLQGEDEWQQ